MEHYKQTKKTMELICLLMTVFILIQLFMIKDETFGFNIFLPIFMVCQMAYANHILKKAERSVKIRELESLLGN